MRDRRAVLRGPRTRELLVTCALAAAYWGAAACTSKSSADNQNPVIPGSGGTGGASGGTFGGGGRGGTAESGGSGAGRVGAGRGGSAAGTGGFIGGAGVTASAGRAGSGNRGGAASAGRPSAGRGNAGLGGAPLGGAAGRGGGGLDAGGEGGEPGISGTGGMESCPPSAPDDGAPCTSAFQCTYFDCAGLGQVNAYCNGVSVSTEVLMCASIACGAGECEPGRLCVEHMAGATAECHDNPCDEHAVTCGCAGELCDGVESCSVNGGTVHCMN